MADVQKFSSSDSIVLGTIWLKRDKCKRFLLAQAPWLTHVSTLFCYSCDLFHFLAVVFQSINSEGFGVPAIYKKFRLVQLKTLCTRSIVDISRQEAPSGQ